MFFFIGNKIYFKFNNINAINNNYNINNNIKFVCPSFLWFLIPSNKIYCFSLIVIIYIFLNLLMMTMMMIFPIYLVKKKEKRKKITVLGSVGGENPTLYDRSC